MADTSAEQLKKDLEYYQKHTDFLRAIAVYPNGVYLVGRAFSTFEALGFAMVKLMEMKSPEQPKKIIEMILNKGVFNPEKPGEKGSFWLMMEDSFRFYGFQSKEDAIHRVEKDVARLKQPDMPGKILDWIRTHQPDNWGEVSERIKVK